MREELGEMRNEKIGGVAVEGGKRKERREGAKKKFRSG